MNVALKVEGITKKQFHEMEPEARSRLMSHLIDKNVSTNASTNPSATPSSAGSPQLGSRDQEDGTEKDVESVEVVYLES